MNTWKTFLAVIAIVFVVSMLWIYWFIGFGEISLTRLTPESKNANFSLGLYNSDGMQFYKNMRYPDSSISYRISDICTLQKKDDASRAFGILGERTVLDFYSVESGEEILISCDSKQIRKGDFFIAGEGGPVNITQAGEFSVISYGEVLLIRQSECMNPNVAIHEILHALGFDHSANPNNIMYNVSKCSQTIGEDIPNLIEKLYSVPSYPDLVLEEVSPSVHERYLDVNISVKNNGFKASEAVEINIYTDDDLLETIDIDSLEIGYGMKFMLKNIQLKRTGFDKMRFVIDTTFEELDKENNEIVFETI